MNGSSVQIDLCIVPIIHVTHLRGTCCMQSCLCKFRCWLTEIRTYPKPLVLFLAILIDVAACYIYCL
jgi:hypothetical protein